MFAVPVTILYKIIYATDEKAPFQDGDAAIDLWTVTFFPMLSDLAFTALGNNKAVSELQETYGPGLDTVLHWVGLGTSIWSCVTAAEDSNYNSWDGANDIISMIPGSGSFLVYLDAPFGPTAAAAIDLFVGWGASVTTIGAAADE